MADKSVDQHRLVAHGGVFDHRVDDVLALFVIVFAFGIQVFDQCEDIGDVDYIAM